MAESLSLVWNLIANDGASGTFRKVGAEAEGASGAVGKLIGGFTALAVGGAIAASVKAASDFQASMLLVQTQAGASRAEVEKMSPAILALAGQVAQAPEALATSLYHVESTGLRGAQALEAVKVAAEGARVGHADLEQTTNALTATIASGMLPATESYAQAMGQLNTIVGSGDMKMQDLNEALGSGLLVVTKQYGVSITDVGAALATFGDNNIRGADAATMLRMAVQSIQTPGKNAAGELERIGLTVKQLQSDEQTGGLNKALSDLHTHLVNSGIDASQWGALLTDAFTKKAGTGLITLIGQFDRFQSKYKEVADGAGSFGDAWSATTKTASFQFSQLRDSLDAVGIKIGTALLPYIADLAKHVSDFVKSSGFQDFLTTAGHDAVIAGDAIRGLVGWVKGLPGPVQEFGLALVALRIADHIGLLDKLGSIAGKTSGAFTTMRQEIQLQQGLHAMQASAISDVDRALGGLGATSGTTGSALGRFGVAAEGVAKGGLSALKAGAGGLMSLFGGPWGVALAGAALGIGALNAMIEHHDEQVKKATDDVAKWYKTLALGGSSGEMASAQQHLDDLRAKIKSMQDGIDAYNNAAASGNARGGIGTLITQQKDLRDELAKGQKQWDTYWHSLSPQQQAVEQVTADEAALAQAIQKHGTASSEARIASAHYNDDLDRQKTLAGQLAGAEQTQIDKINQLANAQLGAISSTLGDAQAQSQLADAVAQYAKDAADGQHSTKQLADESRNLAQQAISAAQAAAKHAVDQAKANGVTDDGTIANKILLDSLKASAEHITGPGHDALMQAITDLQKTTIGSGTLADTVSKMGITVAGVWDANTRVLAGATAQQIQDLTNLGLTVMHLPNGKVVVTADTGPAKDQMQALVDSYKNYQININPQGMALTTADRNALYSGKAAGGPIFGPGTGTSDTAGLFALSNGEHVWTAKEVAAAGGHAAVESLRKAVVSGGHGLAAGGAVVTETARFSDAYIAAAQALIAKMGAMAKANAAASSFSGSGVSGGNAANKALGQQIASTMGLGGQFSAIDYVFSHESGWNNLAQNPTSTAYGIAQFLDSTWASVGGHKTSDPSLQIQYGLKYMNKYGGPNGAASFWQGHHWYDGGGYLMPGVTMAYNGTGKPERIRTAEQESALSGSPMQVTLQLDRDAVTDLLDGRIVSAFTTATNRGQHN